MVWLAFLGAGLFTSELMRNRQSTVEHRRLIAEQSSLRQEAEEQLRAVIESSPAAVVTLDAAGRILLANQAAHVLLDTGGAPLAGQPVGRYLPVFADILKAGGATRRFRSVVEFRGVRSGGDMFLAHAWFSTYETPSGPRLAAIVLDASDHLRDREALGLDSVLRASRILMGAVSHEVRNLSAAAGVAHANLASVPGLDGNEDFKALGTLISGLKEIATSELRLASEKPPDCVDLIPIFDELRILIEPLYRESGIDIRWDIGPGLPLVRGDHHGLLHVLLNLAQNSQRAMQKTFEKRLALEATSHDGTVLVRFRDTGAGVPVPDRLFQPFQPGSEATGLGLYVSRAIVRSFAGDLRYEPQAAGSCFVIELVAATSSAIAAS
jgi:PAS domain S-box-containing protein